MLGLTLVGAVGVGLVAVVTTVVVPITGPVHGDAAPAVALELVAGAGVAAAGLVTVVPAVVVWKGKGGGQGVSRCPARRGLAGGRTAETPRRGKRGTTGTGQATPADGTWGDSSPSPPWAGDPRPSHPTAPAAHRENETQKLHRSAMNLGGPGRPAPQGAPCWGTGAPLRVHPWGGGLGQPIRGVGLSEGKPHACCEEVWSEGTWTLVMKPLCLPGMGTLAWGPPQGSAVDAPPETGQGDSLPGASGWAQG